MKNNYYFALNTLKFFKLILSLKSKKKIKLIIYLIKINFSNDNK